MDIEGGNVESESLYISSFSLYFLPLYPFTISKLVTFCHQMLNTALSSRISQKNLTYALWENNSGSNSLRESSASFEGLTRHITRSQTLRRSMCMCNLQFASKILTKLRPQQVDKKWIKLFTVRVATWKGREILWWVKKGEMMGIKGFFWQKVADGPFWPCFSSPRLGYAARTQFASKIRAVLRKTFQPQFSKLSL